MEVLDKAFSQQTATAYSHGLLRQLQQLQRVVQAAHVREHYDFGFFHPSFDPAQVSRPFGESPHQDYVEHLRGLSCRLDTLPERADLMGIERPNAVAIASARAVLRALTAVEVDAERVVLSAEGGVAVVFYRDGRRATIESLNTGESIASLDDESDPLIVDEQNLFYTLSLIRAHLGGR